MRKSWRNLAIASFLGALVFGVFAGPRLLAVGDRTKDGLRLYTEIIQKSKQSYGGEVLYKDLVYASIQGMLRDLDPHTNFLSPESYASMRERQKESFFGLGILVGVRDGAIARMLENIPGNGVFEPGQAEEIAVWLLRLKENPPPAREPSSGREFDPETSLGTWLEWIENLIIN